MQTLGPRPVPQSRLILKVTASGYLSTHVQGAEGDDRNGNVRGKGGPRRSFNPLPRARNTRAFVFPWASFVFSLSLFSHLLASLFCSSRARVSGCPLLPDSLNSKPSRPFYYRHALFCVLLLHISFRGKPFSRRGYHCGLRPYISGELRTVASQDSHWAHRLAGCVYVR